LAEWTEAEIERLRALVLARELDAQGISEVMGRSRNSIVGRIHRMKLPSPPFSSTQPRARGKAGQFLSDPPPPVVVPKEATEVEVVAWAPPSVPLQPRSEPLPPVRGCQFMDGPGRPWTVCGAPVAPGRSWCREHLARVFIVRRRDGREG